MTKILFVCHGNICRSPMAEFIFKDMVTRAGMAKDFEIASAATSSEELGNPVYPPARRKLKEHGIDCAGKTARRIRREDYAAWDLLIGFDGANIRNMERCFGGDPDGRLHLLLEYAGRPDAIVDDPWYTRDFERAYQDILRGCAALLASLTGKPAE
ncbi:MAG: low molecular weight protein-tyrosine-phosphatase [Eubacterium sp.]|nr:low molecular weight protein-tyrosine-phosphatase [Eubacterium sp.]